LTWGFSSSIRELGDSAGETAVVWNDARDGNQEIYMQIIEPNGEYRFEENGQRIVNCPWHQEDPVVTATSDGYWIVVWCDSLRASENGIHSGDIYCMKFDGEGNRLWGGFNEWGRPVCTQAHPQWRPSVLSDSEGGCYIIWRDNREEGGVFYGIHLDEEGDRFEGWDENGSVLVERPVNRDYVAVCAGNNLFIGWMNREQGVNIKQIPPDKGDVQQYSFDVFPEDLALTIDTGENVFLVYEYTQDNEQHYGIHKFSANGDHIGENSFEFNELFERNEDLDIISTDVNTVVISWIGHLLDQDNSELVAFKITGENELEAVWEEPLAVFANPMDYSISADDRGGFLTVIQDLESVSFVQRIDEEGNLCWNNENQLFIRDTRLDHLEIGFRNNAFQILFNEYKGLGEYSRIYQQQIDLNARRRFEGPGQELLGGLWGNVLRSSSSIILTQTDGLISTWADDKNIWMQVGYDRGEQIEFAHEPGGISISNEEMRVDDWSYCLMDNDEIWYTWKNLSESESIRFQIVSTDGNMMWENGIEISFAHPLERYNQLMCKGDNCAFLVYRIESENGTELYIQKISNQGEAQWNGLGVTVEHSEYLITPQSMIPDGDGGVVILWSIRDDNNDQSKLRISRINDEGDFIWEENNDFLELVEDNVFQRAILRNHSDGYIVIWDELSDLGGEMTAQFINPDGSLAWNDRNVYLGGDIGRDADAAVDNQGNIWVTWTERRDDDLILLQKISPQVDDRGVPELTFVNDNGNPRSKVLCNAAENQRESTIVHDGGNGVWVIWEDYRNTIRNASPSNGDIYGIHLNENANPYQGWERNGNIISEADNNQEDPSVVLLNSGNDGCVVMWEDKRSGWWGYERDLYIQRIDDNMVTIPEQNFIPHPSSFILSAPFPNPFNSTTTIEYALPYTSDVTLSLYNLSGRRVETLVNGRVKAGVHRVILDAGDLASGLYFVKLEKTKQSVTQKIMLVK